MSHAHHHHHGNKLGWAVFVNILLSVAQVVGGILSGSLSLVADALHNLSDAGALIIALVAQKVARKPASLELTYGYQRAEIIGALINSATLIVVGVYLLFEAISRFLNPEPIDGWIVVWLAALALVIDVITALITYSAGAKTSLNIRAAFIHNVSDAAASVAVIVAGTLIILYQWYVVDLIATVLISAYVIYHGVELSKSSIRILMQATPDNINIQEVKEYLETQENVKTVSHIHVWQLNEHEYILEAQVVITSLSDQSTLARLKEGLQSRFGLLHTTLELTEDSLITHQCVEIK
ncbi:cation diffusion facilitator family transporter [Pseudoalteromonas piscicida]|uniref:Cation transporter n=1 Tax=Pseudoalteromonas piscicida TaxID=43662 RepID=A0AAD0RMJ5_PSEO7|nr:cation diffusion facilitator family transporter [Pseudoalteromonas piscicida]ASD68995.1 cation transporter [Pseudoalteromonas piscicida]AXR00513.1 cation transporter [Pseudoalteromonas piscicida]AXR04633.1 cation transporter [Pseudoalteromonas piscicida]